VESGAWSSVNTTAASACGHAGRERSDGGRTAAAHPTGHRIRPSRRIVSAAVDDQHTLTVTAEADDRQNPVRGGASGLGTDHHSAPPRRRQAIGGRLNGGTPLAPVPVPS
jgi:hypothetical protein